MNSFYSREELIEIGFKKIGENVLISRKTSFYSPEKIEIGSNVRIDDFCVLSGGKGIKIGNDVHIACFCVLYGNEKIELKDFCGLSSRVAVYTASDDYSGFSLTNPTVPGKYKSKMIKGPVILKKHVVIGTNSTIMPNVTVGTGTSIGAHSFVTQSLEKFGIYFGIPVRKIGKRSKRLLELEKRLLTSHKRRR